MSTRTTLAYPDITIDDDWTRLELEIALRELRDGAPPLQVFRDLTGDARKWLVTHLSRRGWDIVAGVPVKRAGAGDPEFALDLQRNVGGASRRYGGSDEQFNRTIGDGTMRVNGWGRRW